MKGSGAGSDGAEKGDWKSRRLRDFEAKFKK
jgi:hypothetical protein